jgi:hypothetical protein
MATAEAHGAESPAPQPTSEPSGHVSSSDALALAGIVAAASPLLSSAEKEAVALLFAGSRNISYTKKIVVTADKIVCRASNVDITSRSCEMTFGKTVKSLSGRAANELYATEAMAGVPSDGAAGTMYEGLSKLECAIDPQEIEQAGGGGAVCSFLAE